MLIDCSYFTKGARYILNASMGTMPNPNAVEVCRAIEAHIAEHQERFLIRMLGSHLGNKVNAYLVCKEEDGTENENLNAVCERLKESFADYVFYQILRTSSTQSTITGLVRLKNGNEYVSPMSRQIISWNTMVERNRLFQAWACSDECPIKGIAISAAMTTRINSLNL